VANILGYATHSAYLQKYAERHLHLDISAKIAMTITPADIFRPVPGKKNILFTMWEFLDLPDNYIAGMNRADAIIVPSRFCKELLSRYTKKPIYTCWEGIEPEHYPYYQRAFPDIKHGRRFRLLWVGAPNARKGYLSILEVIKLVEQIPELEIYIKTTAPRKTPFKEYPAVFWGRIKRIFKERDPEARKNEIAQLQKSLKKQMKFEIADKFSTFGKYKNIFVDTRKITTEEMRNLYNSAHCFLLPTMGEGWGLTLCEAMATGCPSIATNVTGVSEFFGSDFGYELKYEVKPVDLRDYFKLKTSGYAPDTRHLIEQVIYVFKNYQEALRKGARASAHIHGKFTWDNSAKRLAQIITEFEAAQAKGAVMAQDNQDHNFKAEIKIVDGKKQLVVEPKTVITVHPDGRQDCTVIVPSLQLISEFKEQHGI
jgi:glycosyltransferase involved in cell wall biosynthesis